MGFDHPISWCHIFDGGRAWYTGAGHTQESYNEPNFRQHVLGGILWAAGAADGDAGATIDSNFQKVILDAAPQNPMQLAIAPDGRVCFVELRGALKIWKPDTRAVVVAGVLAVDAAREDGLLGIALDPGFATNNWIYLFYSVPGLNEQHISRFQMNGDTLDAASEKLVLTIPVNKSACCHSAGGLDFDRDGNLYIGVGDNTTPFESDGYAPIDERAGRAAFDAQKSSSNANDLRGKILRIHPETNGGYTIPSGNLFAPGTPNTRPEIYVMGARNPFRFSIDAETSFLYWGDVGPDAGSDNDLRGPRGHDEINQARSAGNYGWPYFVANNKAYRDYDFSTQLSGPAFDPNAPTNESPNNTGPRELPPARPGWIWYSYVYPSIEFPETDQPGNFFRCAMAGPVYHSNSGAAANDGLPRYYDKTLFVYDWARQFIKEIKLDDDGQILKINPFLPTFSFLRPIDMKIGPDGAIYMIEWGTDFGGGPGGKVIRIDYSGGNQLVVLQTAESLNGPFTDEPTILFDEDTRTFTAPLVGQERFFRLRSTAARVISDVSRVGNRLRITVD